MNRKLVIAIIVLVASSILAGCAEEKVAPTPPAAVKDRNAREESGG